MMTRGQVLATRAALLAAATLGYVLLAPSEPMWLLHAAITSVVAGCGVLAMPLDDARGGRGLLTLSTPAQAGLVAALVVSATLVSAVADERPTGGGPWPAVVVIAVLVYGPLWWSTSRRGGAARRGRVSGGGPRGSSRRDELPGSPT